MVIYWDYQCINCSIDIIILFKGIKEFVINQRIRKYTVIYNRKLLQ